MLYLSHFPIFVGNEHPFFLSYDVNQRSTNRPSHAGNATPKQLKDLSQPPPMVPESWAPNPRDVPKRVVQYVAMENHQC